MNSEVLKNGTERVKRVDFGDMYVCVDNIPVARSRRERDHHLQARAEWYVIKYNLKGYYKCYVKI